MTTTFDELEMQIQQDLSRRHGLRGLTKNRYHQARQLSKQVEL
jgi:hypothetical protein